MKKTLLMFCLLTPSLIGAQNTQYDPLLEPAVKILKDRVGDSSGTFLWYPGQLSAHLQQRRVQESGERCVYVGYPGKFYAPVDKAFFRKEVNFPSETRVEWTSTGNVKMYVNDQFVDNSDVADGMGGADGEPGDINRANSGNRITGHINLPKGKAVLLFEVSTEKNLPAIKVAFDASPVIDGWSASLNGSDWNFAETSPVFGVGGGMPLDDSETEITLRPVSIVPVRNAVVDGDKIIIQKNGYVLIDFFHLEMGQVTFTAKGNGQLTAFVGESPEEALNEKVEFFEQQPIHPYSLSATETQITLPERAVRYLKVFCDEACELSSVTFTAKVWPVDFQMSFECDDARINRIWSASVASLHTSTHGFYLDGIKRDYLPWSMDAVLSTFGGDYVFSDKQVSLNSLSVALLPFNPDRSDLGIPDYPLHALVGFQQHDKRYGDFNTIRSYRDRIEQLLRFYETIQDERGFISANVGTWGFVPGWATTQGPERKGTPAYAQIMLYYNYKIGALFCEKWGDKKANRHYRTLAETLRKSIFKHFWNEEKGVFINGYTQDGELDEGISHHAQYWAILAGIFPEHRYDNLFDILPKIPDYQSNVSYEKGYEFLAYAKARRVSDMWDFLFTVFDDWLEQGHTRFPENFGYQKTKDAQLIFYDRPYGLSLCHGANGVPGIVAVLNGIAGFSQSDTKRNHYTLQPDMMDLQWVHIEFPVKEGIIKLKLSKEGTHELEIPAGCQVDFIHPNGTKSVFSKKGSYSCLSDDVSCFCDGTSCIFSLW